MTIQAKIDADYLLGAICHEGTYRFFMNPLAWWILDYAAYDPSITLDVERKANFRNGLMRVSITNGSDYLQSISEDEVSVEQVKDQQQNGEDKLILTFFIDFDSGQFVSHFYDVEVESYVPEGWAGVFDDPVDHLPQPVKQLFA